MQPLSLARNNQGLSKSGGITPTRCSSYSFTIADGDSYIRILRRHFLLGRLLRRVAEPKLVMQYRGSVRLPAANQDALKTRGFSPCGDSLIEKLLIIRSVLILRPLTCPLLSFT